MYRRLQVVSAIWLGMLDKKLKMLYNFQQNTKKGSSSMESGDSSPDPYENTYIVSSDTTCAE